MRCAHTTLIILSACASILAFLFRSTTYRLVWRQAPHAVVRDVVVLLAGCWGRRRGQGGGERGRGHGGGPVHRAVSRAEVDNNHGRRRLPMSLFPSVFPCRWRTAVGDGGVATRDGPMVKHHLRHLRVTPEDITLALTQPDSPYLPIAFAHCRWWCRCCCCHCFRH